VEAERGDKYSRLVCARLGRQVCVLGGFNVGGQGVAVLDAVEAAPEEDDGASPPEPWMFRQAVAHLNIHNRPEVSGSACQCRTRGADADPVVVLLGDLDVIEWVGAACHIGRVAGSARNVT
jgi:hypothetical protein